MSTIALLRGPVLLLPESLSTHGPTPPLGLAYVAAALREAGHDVHVVDGPGEAMERSVRIESPIGELDQIGLSIDEIIDRIPSDTDVVGITTMFLHEWPTVRALAERVKERHPDVTVVLGGENATAFSRWILEQSRAIDCCVLGEGEATMVALVERLEAGRSLRGLAGIALHEDDGSIVDNGLSIRLTKQELADTIPRPAWDLFPLDPYFEHYPFFGVNRGRSMNVLGTRGCPYKCTFCSSPQMWTTKYVVREPEDVVDEIVEYVDRFGIQNVNFVDLTAATNRKWTLGLCDALEARAPGVSWQLPVGTRIEAIDREVLQRIYDTNCRNITFAPESGSQRMLDIMDKRVKLDKVLDAVRDGNEIGLKTMINIIIGHPEERWSDLRQSVRFLLKAAWAGCSDIAVMMFCPYPGSADFESLVASGRHQVDEYAYYVGLSRGSAAHMSWNDDMSARQLRILQVLMIAAFYVASWIRRPVRALRFLRSQLGGEEETYLAQMVRTKRRKIDRLSRRDARRQRRVDVPAAAPAPVSATVEEPVEAERTVVTAR
jgi:radical SAM superfamily enzyme YgiQ (UPF0313 family)